MSIWALSDLHLCFGVPDKSMEIFGPEWTNYPEKIKENWLKNIKKEDLVLIPGDISWGKDLEEAAPDFEFIESLPGTKVILKGNHDYWWTTISKLKTFLPPSCHFIHNDVFNFGKVSIAGARLWDTKEFNFNGYIRYVENPKASKKNIPFDNEKIFSRELQRLQLSLDLLDKKAGLKIVMCHYPPINAKLDDSIASKKLEERGVNICVFGHLHHVDKSQKMFGEKNGVRYFLTSADYLDFNPLKIASL